MTNKPQNNTSDAPQFIWVPITLHAGRGEVRGDAALSLQAVFSLQLGVAKWVPVVVGGHRQLSVLRNDSQLAILRNSIRVAEVDWDQADKSEHAQDSLRILASPAEIRLIMDSNRGAVRLSFPESITRANLLDFKSDIIVVISGLMVEFWSIEKWREFLQTTAENRSAAIDVIQTIRK